MIQNMNAVTHEAAKDSCVLIMALTEPKDNAELNDGLKIKPLDQFNFALLSYPVKPKKQGTNHCKQI